MLAIEPSYSSLTLADSFTFLAFAAKFNVETVSDMAVYLDERVAMRIVLEFPPKESRRILVNTESR